MRPDLSSRVGAASGERGDEAMKWSDIQPASHLAPEAGRSWRFATDLHTFKAVSVTTKMAPTR
jgi:hypothetical protein